MKKGTTMKIMTMATSLMAFLSCGGQAYTNLDTDAFEKKAAEEGTALVDVRTAGEYAEGHLKGAANIDCQEDGFLGKIEAAYPKETPLAIYCRSGKRSAAAAKKLAKAGYTVFNMLGGINAWTEAGKGIAKNGDGILVAYFSATGTTAAVAADLAEATGATLYEIKPAVKYTDADLDWRNENSRSSVEMKDKESRPEIVKDLEDAGSYDTIFIGFPVWWYTAPTLINTFVEAYGFEGKTVIFFATSGGSDLKKANADFKAAYPKIDWKDGKTLNGESKEEIKAWADSLLR